MRKFNYFYPSLGKSWTIVLILVAGAGIFGILLGLMNSILPSPVWTNNTFSYILTMLVPMLYIWFAARRAYEEAPITGTVPVKLNAPEFGRFNPFLFFCTAAVAMLALQVVVEPLGNLIPMNDMFKKAFERAFVDSSLPDMILSACILAPLLEEFLCRGIIMRGILVSSSSPAKAIIWSAFIFAFIHMNPWQAIPAFIIGILFGWIYYRTGCLWATIFLHWLNNSASTVLTRVLPEAPVDATLAYYMPHSTYCIVYAAAAVILAAAIWLLQRNMSHITKI